MNKIKNRNVLPVINFLLFLFMLLIFSKRIYAQDTTNASPDTVKYWTINGFTGLNFNQLNFSNWAEGGENSISATGLANVNLKYKKGDLNWETKADIAYGRIMIEGDETRKTEDRLEINSKVGKNAFKKAFYTALVNFRTQFDEGFDREGEAPVLISDFMSPAYLTLSLGLDLKPRDYFNIYFSPVTAKVTFVLSDQLSGTNFGLDPGEEYRREIGAYFVTGFQKDILKNVNLKSNLELFNNYADKNKDNRKNIDANWETLVTLKVNKYISATITTHLKYDHNVKVPVDRNDDGIIDGRGPRIQFKESIAVGVGYKF